MIIASTSTAAPAIHAVNEACWNWESQPGVLDCTFFHDFGWTDLPRSGVSVYEATDGDALLAKHVAEDVARFIWDHRQEYLFYPLPPAEAIARAMAIARQPIVINDGSDDPGGVALGDGTYLLRAMLDARLKSACFGFLIDPEVAAQAHAAGAGSTIQFVWVEKLMIGMAKRLMPRRM